MLNWLDIKKFARNGNPKPPGRVDKTDAEWKKLLTPEQYKITRQHGTERAFTGEYCTSFEPGIYACVCCDTLLFDSRQKFESGTGWPSFSQPLEKNVIQYIEDSSFGMSRIETLCNVCDAHLGHVFPDGPKPGGLRYCMNSAALKKVESKVNAQLATFGGGCFWCTEAIFQSLSGVNSVTSGYSGGTTHNPTYKQVCMGTTGHAEVVQINFDPEVISFVDLVKIHMYSHDPTTLNRQGADVGTQYRSAIFYHDDEQKASAEKVIGEAQNDFNHKIVTTLEPFTAFYEAEDYHQNYYLENANQPYCSFVITPKLKKLREKYSDKLRKEAV